jgi:plastocyanin
VGHRCACPFTTLSSPIENAGQRRDPPASFEKGGIDLRRLIALPAVAALLAVSAVPMATAAAAAPNVINISVNKGSLHSNKKTVTAKAGLVTINLTNNSTAPHNVSLEHNGEFEYGASLTIKNSSITTFLTLAKGTYHLYSSVGTDEDKGMSATLVIK